MAKQKQSPAINRRTRNSKSVSRLSVSNSHPLSIIRRIEGPFYSDAFKAWRIQYYEYGVVFEKVCEASLYCERVEDAKNVGKFFTKVATWQDWQKAVAVAQKILKEKPPQGYAYVIQQGRYISLAKNTIGYFPAP
jgi:hypothetical protein